MIKQKETIQAEKNVEKQEGVYDLIIFMGQSNMAGRGGNASEAVKGIAGAGYELKFDESGEVEGLDPVEEPFGSETNSSVGGSMVTGFMNAYYNNSGTPVIGIAAAYNDKSIYDYWQKGQDGLENTKTKVQKATEWLEKNNYKVRHKYMVWNHGETDHSRRRSDAPHLGIGKMLHQRHCGTVSRAAPALHHHSLGGDQPEAQRLCARHPRGQHVPLHTPHRGE